MKQMFRAFLAAAALAGLVACGVPLSNDILAAEVALTAAEKAATIYAELPRCPAAALCSSQATVNKLKVLDNTAYNAVKSAQANPALVNLAITAITAFKDALPQ